MVAAVGRLKAGPERELAARYLERAQSACRAVGIAGVEVREFDESRARTAIERKAAEGETIAALVSKGGCIFLLDERGKSISSEDFAREIAGLRDAAAGDCVIAIGGPDGASESLRESAAKVLSFGAMTWPHQLARVMALEQVYRAITILSGHPYHRA